MLMEPNNSANLDRFLDSYQRVGAFCLMPGYLENEHSPKFAPDLAIVKRNLVVKSVEDVDEQDPETIVLRSHFGQEPEER